MRRAFFFIGVLLFASTSFASIPRTSILDDASSRFEPSAETRIGVSDVFEPFARPVPSPLNRALHQAYAELSTTSASGLAGFLSVDPVLNIDHAMRNPQGWNRYAYVTNNPLRKVDPDGRDEFEALLPPSPYPHMAEVLRSGGNTFEYHWAQFKDKPFEVMADVLALGMLGAEIQMTRAMPVIVEPELLFVSSSLRSGPVRQTFYRGGETLVAAVKDLKIQNGLVQPTRGVSINRVAGEVSRFGGAYRIGNVPSELTIVQRGKNPNHFEIVPKEPMTQEKYQKLLDKITLELVK
jgi:hypothetical protein